MPKKKKAKTVTLLTTHQAARILKVSPARVRQFCLEGRFSGAKHFGRDWAIPEAEVREFAKAPRPAGNPIFGAE